MDIRPADLSDLDTLMRLEDLCFGIERFAEQTVLAFLMRDDAFVLVAQEKGELIGVAMNIFSEEHLVGRMASVAVVEERRREGIGGRLVEASESRFAQEGIRRIRLEVSMGNDPAIRMYLKHGFSIQAVIEGYYGPGRDAYVMEKVIGVKGNKVKVPISEPRGRRASC